MLFCSTIYKPFARSQSSFRTMKFCVIFSNKYEELVNLFWTYLKILGKAISIVLLVEPLGVHGASHLQDLEVSLQLLRDLRGFHVKPAISCWLTSLLLPKEITFISEAFKLIHYFWYITTKLTRRFNFKACLDSLYGGTASFFSKSGPITLFFITCGQQKNINTAKH